MIRSGDSPSLWNCSLSPGWTREEIAILRQAIMKFGVGNWLTILNSHCLPGKNPAQMSMQAQRMLGQQSIREFMKIQLDTDLVWQKNQRKAATDDAGRYLVKGGILIYNGPNRTREWFRRRLEKNVRRYQLPDSVVNSVRLPAPPRRQPPRASAHAARLRRLAVLRRRLAVVLAELESRCSPTSEHPLKHFEAPYEPPAAADPSAVDACL
jgi:hypothetical protein